MSRIQPTLVATNKENELADDKIWLDKIEVLLTNTTNVKEKAYKESALHSASLVRHRSLMAFLTLFGDFALSATLGFFGIFISYCYAGLDIELTPRTDDDPGSIDQFFFLFVVVGPIYTIWNIAQYASFAIQTTGHIWPRNHLWALLDVGPLLLCTNMVAWILLVIAYYYLPLNTVPVVFVHVPIMAVAILTGIWCKTYAKVGYVYGKYHKHKFAVRDDAFVDKYYALLNDFHVDYGVMCPFQEMNKKTVARQAFAPVLCFLWTAIYTIGLGLLYKLSDHIAFQWFLFFLTLSIYMFGNWLLQSFIKKSSGIMMYSKKMIVIFCYIYGMVACSQVRLVITKFSGESRLAASLTFAALSFSLRQYSSKSFRQSYESFKDKGSEVLGIKKKASGNLDTHKYTVKQKNGESPDTEISIAADTEIESSVSVHIDSVLETPNLTPNVSPVKPRRASLNGSSASGEYQGLPASEPVSGLRSKRALFGNSNDNNSDNSNNDDSPINSERAISNSDNSASSIVLPGQTAQLSAEDQEKIDADKAALQRQKSLSTQGFKRKGSLKRQSSVKRKNSLSRKQTLRRLSTTGEQLKPFIALSRRADQLCISVVASLITQNVCTILLGGLSCMLHDSKNTVLTLGECPNGLFNQLFTDLGPLLLFDIMEICIFVYYFKIPTIHFFVQFDWFMVVAALLVVYLDVVVLLWAVSPLFG